jgi:ribosomal protein L24E
MSPTTCEFCGGPIQEGRRFVIIDKGKTWTAFFCSNVCSLGWAVVRLVRPDRAAADVEVLSLSERYGEEGSWWPGPGGTIH